MTLPYDTFGEEAYYWKERWDKDGERRVGILNGAGEGGWSRGRRKSRRVDSGREGEVEGQGKGAASCDSNINNLDQHAAAGTVAGKADGGIQRERERRKAKQGRGRTQLQTVKM